MEWDGSDAFQPPAGIKTTEQPPVTTRKSKTQPAKRTEKPTQAEESETKWKKPRQASPVEMSQSSDDESGDEYVDDDTVAAAGTKRKRRVRHQSTNLQPTVTHRATTPPQPTLGASSRRVIAMSSESDDDGELSERDGKVRRRGPGAATKVKASLSPQPTSGTHKGKQSLSAAGAGTGKRKRAESQSTTMSAAEDPARKYCLGKFTEMFSGIFLRYPYVRQKGEGDAVPQEMEPMLVERKAEELSEEEKAQAKERATAFAAEVEQAVFDTYAEIDKFGKNGVGAKYKYVFLAFSSFHSCSMVWSRERFRTLTFNLQQSDRVLLHQRISSAQVAPATLATMSSTELASQEQQQSIKQAEQEALAHSILIKSNVPRAKITHKGLQDIEDVNEDSAVAKQRRERELEMAEEERERERLARLRAVQPHSNPPSASVPPESPVVPSASSASAPWNTAAPTQGQGTESAHTNTAVDSELNLGDFIHMDDEPPETTLPLTITTSSTTTAATAAAAAAPSATSTSEPLSATALTTPITGISPFAPSKPDMPPRASFDLNALWSAPPPPAASMSSSEEQVGEEKEKVEEVEERGGGEGEPMEMDLGTPPDEPVTSASAAPASVAVASGELPEREVDHEGESDDLDFAMFLGQEEDENGGKGKTARPEASLPDPQAVFDGLSRVWNGVVSSLIFLKPFECEC